MKNYSVGQLVVISITIFVILIALFSALNEESRLSACREIKDSQAKTECINDNAPIKIHVE